MSKNTAQGKALKLLYNSAYGKMAQSIGEPKLASSHARSPFQPISTSSEEEMRIHIDQIQWLNVIKSIRGIKFVNNNATYESPTVFGIIDSVIVDEKNIEIHFTSGVILSNLYGYRYLECVEYVV